MRIIHLSFLFILNSLSILCSAQDFEGEIVFSAYHKYTDSSIKSTPNLPSNVGYKISAEHVRIEGKPDADITADHLEVSNTGTIDGKLKTNSLSVDPGAQISGNVSRIG